MGEVEVVFGLWALVLGVAIYFYYDWHTFVGYLEKQSYKEALFILVIMTIASSRPILKLFEMIMWQIVRAFKGSLAAWWFTILLMAAPLSSLITGPAAMTICAFLLAEKFYSLQPSHRLKYATLALLFINVSVGGGMTNFASPPILMVARVWQWDNAFMLSTFGLPIVISVIVPTILYYFMFRSDLDALKEPYENYRYEKYIQRRFISEKELENLFAGLEHNVDLRIGFSSELNAYSEILKENIKALAKSKLSPEELEQYDINKAIDEKFESIKLEEMRRTIPGLLPSTERPQYNDPNWDNREDPVPFWIILSHIGFLIWTIFSAHEPVLFLGGFMFYLGFYQVTFYYQNRLDLRPALLVAFFIAGIVIHGTLQAWWIAPVLANLPELGLNVTAIVLTAFNDNAAITYLATLVTGFPDELKYAIVSGAITGGGLTIIANSPNPIGQSVLKKHFSNGISAAGLAQYALVPTVIAATVFYLFR
jgi:Na+/H+ antiporter NhaD/arsenite permease-like protein